MISLNKQVKTLFNNFISAKITYDLWFITFKVHCWYLTEPAVKKKLIFTVKWIFLLPNSLILSIISLRSEVIFWRYFSVFQFFITGTFIFYFSLQSLDTLRSRYRCMFFNSWSRSWRYHKHTFCKSWFRFWDRFDYGSCYGIISGCCKQNLATSALLVTYINDTYHPSGCSSPPCRGC